MNREQTSPVASSRRGAGLRLGVLLAGLLLFAAVAAGCGESDEEKAQTQVCDARADIKKQVDELAALTPTTATVDGVRGNLSAIRDDLSEITDAQGNLSEERRQEFESATQEFTSELQAVADGLISSLSIDDAKAQLQTAVKQLSNSYEQAFAQVDCE
jgi:hypothetical protein